MLERHSWPGNVRELEHVIGRASMMTDNPNWLSIGSSGNLVRYRSPHGDNATARRLSSPLAAHELRLLDEALKASRGNQSEAARPWESAVTRYATR